MNHEKVLPQADETNLEIRRLRMEFKLTRRELAALTLHSPSAVSNWLLPPESASYRVVHPSIVRLLKLELGRERPLVADVAPS